MRIVCQIFASILLHYANVWMKSIISAGRPGFSKQIEGTREPFPFCLAHQHIDGKEKVDNEP